jgi:hypothetical protein
MAAYPTVTAPYGFKPINRVDGMPYAGAIQQLPITQAGAIYNGDLVELDVGGVVGTATSLTSGAKLGVLVGCQYTNSTGQTVQAQFYPGSSVTNAVAYVVVDANAAFQVAVTNSAGAITTVTRAVVGTNVTALVNTPSATTGNSAQSILNTSPAADATFPIRVIAVVPETATSATTYTEVIVKINLHQYNTALGNAVA